MDAEERKWLIELRIDMKWLKEKMTNHLHHHLLYTIAFVGVIGGLLATLLLK